MADSQWWLKLTPVIDLGKLEQDFKLLSEKSTIKFDATGAAKGATTTKKYADAVGTLRQQTVRYNKVGKVTSTTTEHIVATTNKAIKANKNLSASYNNLTVSANKTNSAFGKIGSIFDKVIMFGGVTDAVNTLTEAFHRAIEVVSEYDKAQTEMKKVSDLSGGALDDYGKKLGDLGTGVARTRTEMANLSIEFLKSGFSPSESAVLAKTAALYQNIADEELSAGEAANFIIAQMKAFNLTAQDSEHIIDAVNQISNNMSVSSADLT